MTAVEAEPLADDHPAVRAIKLRHEAARRLLPDTEAVEERVSLLAAVVSPDESATYADESVVDGTYWDVAAEQEGRRVRSSGANAYPKGFEALCAAVSALAGGRTFE